MEKNQYKDVYVFVEQREGQVQPVALELLGKARTLADALKEQVVAILAGCGVKDKAAELIAHGADRVIVVDSPELKEYTTEPYAQTIHQIIEAKRQQREPVIIPHFSAHHLRHTFCSRLCEGEMNVKVIQQIMGHKNVETTLDIYTEVSFKKKQDSLDELSQKMNFL